jgi:hypothetical protein
VRPAAPLPIESPVSSSLISSDGSRSTAQFPALPRPEPFPPLAGDARMRRPPPIIRVPKTASAPQSGLSLGCSDAIKEGEEAVGRNENPVSYVHCSERRIVALSVSKGKLFVSHRQRREIGGFLWSGRGSICSLVVM